MRWLKPLIECPKCHSRDYEYYPMKNLERRTDWIEHKCLKCRCKWRYNKGEAVIL